MTLTLNFLSWGSILRGNFRNKNEIRYRNECLPIFSPITLNLLGIFNLHTSNRWSVRCHAQRNLQQRTHIAKNAELRNLLCCYLRCVQSREYCYEHEDFPSILFLQNNITHNIILRHWLIDVVKGKDHPDFRNFKTWKRAPSNRPNGVRQYWRKIKIVNFIISLSSVELPEGHNRTFRPVTN